MTIPATEQIRLLTHQQVQEAIAAKPDASSDFCAEYQKECNPEEFIRKLRKVIDRPHGDDSACDDPVMMAVEGAVYRALEGAAQALNIDF